MRRGSMAASAVVAGVLTLGLGSGAGGCQQWNKMWHKGDEEKVERTSMSALPQPVKDAFHRDYPNANLTYVGRETEKDGAIHYEFKFTDQSGRKQDVEYDGNGMRVHEEK